MSDHGGDGASPPAGPGDADDDPGPDTGENSGSGIGDDTLTRRKALKGIAGVGALFGAGRAADNVLFGYGVVVGTNLTEQDLAGLASRGFRPGGRPIVTDDHEITGEPDAVRILDGSGEVASFDPSTTDSEEARAIGAEYGYEDASAELARDLGAVAAGEHVFEFHDLGAFFERVRNGDTRPGAVARLRENRYTDVEPATVEAFAGADPREPKAVVDGLVGAFRGHTSYDIPRYAAGSVEDNVLLGSVDLRQHFESPTAFEALEDGRNSGLFCYEFVYRSVEALHSVSAYEQTTPVFGGRVHDERHKHAFTAIGSVLREDDQLVIPMTFVDYTHSTLYDDLALRGVMGRGLEAYNDRHRATDIYWNN